VTCAYLWTFTGKSYGGNVPILISLERPLEILILVGPAGVGNLPAKGSGLVLLLDAFGEAEPGDGGGLLLEVVRGSGAIEELCQDGTVGLDSVDHGAFEGLAVLVNGVDLARNPFGNLVGPAELLSGI